MFPENSLNFEDWLVSSPASHLDCGLTGCLSPKSNGYSSLITTVSAFSLEDPVMTLPEKPLPEPTLSLAPQIPTVAKNKKAPAGKKIAGRPVTGIPYDQREYLNALEGRTLFRVVTKVFKSFRSGVWAKLAETCSEKELTYLRNFFSDGTCSYSYKKDGDKRDVGDRATSPISLLCYKINKNVQDEYLMNPLLTHAFLKARPEIIENFAAAFAKDKADAVVQKFADLCEKYEAEIHPKTYAQTD